MFNRGLKMIKESLGLMFSLEYRQYDGKNRTIAGTRFREYRAAILLRNLFTNCKTYASTFITVFSVKALKDDEYFFGVFFFKTDTVVHETNRHVFF